MTRLDFIILYCVVMMCFGLTASLFYPDQYSFGREDVIGMGDEITDLQEDNQGSWLDALGGFVTGITQILRFLWACLSFNIPYCPWIVRTVLVAPFHAGMIYIIITTIRGN